MGPLQQKAGTQAAPFFKRREKMNFAHKGGITGAFILNGFWDCYLWEVCRASIVFNQVST